MLFDSSLPSSSVFSQKSLVFGDDETLPITKPIFVTTYSNGTNNFSGIGSIYNQSISSKSSINSTGPGPKFGKTKKKLHGLKEKKIKEHDVDKRHNPKKLRLKNSTFNNGRWTQEEHKRFIESIIKHGNDWRMVEKHIGTRSSTQARSHAQKFFEKMKLANMVDEAIDLDNKTSIKSLHETLKLMEKEKYLYTVEDLSAMAFERKKSTRSVKSKNKANNEDIPENFGDLETLDSLSSKESKNSLVYVTEDKDEKESEEQNTATKTAENVTRNDIDQDIMTYLSVNLTTPESLSLALSVNYTPASSNYLNTLSNPQTNKMLKRKRLRNFSYTSIDLGKHLVLEIDDSELDEIDFQNILIQMFAVDDKSRDTDDVTTFGEALYDALYVGNNEDFNENYILAYENSSRSLDNGEGDELYEEFLV